MSCSSKHIDFATEVSYKGSIEPYKAYKIYKGLNSLKGFDTISCIPCMPCMVKIKIKP